MRPTARALAAIVVAAGLLRMTAPVAAHHAFSAEFDANRPIKLEGVVTKVEWINPHSWIHIEVRKPDGSSQAWMIEAGAPNSLTRRGFTKESLPIGTKIVVDGYQAKDGAARANGRDLTFSDGKKLFMGSSGTGAPVDGRDPTEKSKK